MSIRSIINNASGRTRKTVERKAAELVATGAWRYQDDEAPAEPGTAAPDPVDVDDVPEGTVAEIVEWVGGDQQRAAAALATELDRQSPRQSLLDKLSSIS